MDAERFDYLSHLLPAGSRRRYLANLCGVAVGAFTRLLSVAEADAHNARLTCKKIKEKQRRQRCVKRAKKHNRKHATATPPCIPEAPATNCAPGCGMRPNTCGQLVACPCPAGQDCLTNGSCARPCTDDAHCPQTCFNCGPASAEGPRYCNLPLGCADIPQVCDTTAQCPRGELCLRTGCTPNPKRCVPLCPS